jgi:uncharacterized membrane protein YfcA
MHAGLPRDVLSLLLGFLTGLLSALFGIGGAIVSNPGLRALGAAPLVAVGTTLPSILPGAVSGTLRYRREGLIDWRLITPAAAAGLLAVVGGSLLSHAVPGQGHLLLLFIAVLVAFTAWRTAFTASSRDPENNPEPSASPGRRQRWVAAGIGLVAGLLSGLLGIGGGVIMVPAFSELLSLPLKSAIATSLVCADLRRPRRHHPFLPRGRRLAAGHPADDRRHPGGPGSGPRSRSAPPNGGCGWPLASSLPCSPCELRGSWWLSLVAGGAARRA